MDEIAAPRKITVSLPAEAIRWLDEHGAKNRSRVLLVALEVYRALRLVEGLAPGIEEIDRQIPLERRGGRNLLRRWLANKKRLGGLRDDAERRRLGS
jgi:hypothetical protein